MIPLFWRKTRSVKIEEINSFTLSYTVGTTANANVYCNLARNEEGYIANFKPANVADEEEKEFVVDESFVLKLKQLLIENNVGKWNGFNKSSKIVLDGDRFYLSVRMENGTDITARGYMEFPENYSVVARGVTDLFEREASEKG